MLTSITPLGERSRGNRWVVTVGGFITGSVVGGAIVGAVLGLTGEISDLAALGPAVRLGVLALVVSVSLLTDLGLFAHSVAGPRRQVNEDWLSRYRGWAYGLGFGLQLGAGVTTIITSATVYATLVAALLSAHPSDGALIGAWFGLLRAAPVLLTGGVRHTRDLVAVAQLLLRWDSSANRTVVVGQCLTLTLLAAAVIVNS